MKARATAAPGEAKARRSSPSVWLSDASCCVSPRSSSTARSGAARDLAPEVAPEIGAEIGEIGEIGAEIGEIGAEIGEIGAEISSSPQ